MCLKQGILPNFLNLPLLDVILQNCLISFNTLLFFEVYLLSTILFIFYSNLYNILINQQGFTDTLSFIVDIHLANSHIKSCKNDRFMNFFCRCFLKIANIYGISTLLTVFKNCFISSEKKYTFQINVPRWNPP